MASPVESATPADVLRWCAAAAPGLWFPSDHAATTGLPRDALDDPLWRLRQAGLVQVGDWVKGRGQGFTLTPAGREALTDPAKLARAADPPAPPPIFDVPPAIPPDPAAAPPAPTLTAYDRGELARQAVLAPRRPIVTPIGIGLCSLWFLAETLLAERAGIPTEQFLAQGDGKVALAAGAVDGHHLLAGQWWRLLSAGFVHLGLVHLLANMLGLGMAGPVAESLWGRWRMTLIGLMGILAGNSLAMLMRPEAVLAGASGGIWAILTAILVWIVRNRQHLPEDVFSDSLRRLMLLLVINAAISFAPGISWQAHLGGGVAGAVAAVGLDLARPGSGRGQLLGWALVGLAAAAGPVGLAAGLRPTPPPPKKVELPLPIPGTPVSAAHWAVTIAVVTRSPATLEEARRRLAELRPISPEAARYADLAESYLNTGRLPTKDEWDALHAARRLAEGTHRP